MRPHSALRLIRILVRADMILGLAIVAATFLAVTDFAGDPGLGQQVAGIIANNLRRSGYFVPIEKARFPEQQPSFDAAPRFEAWKAAGVQGLVTGRVTRDPSGRLKTEFRLWDVYAGQQVAGQQYFTDPNNWRRIGHIISDAVYTKITGVGAFFDTRVVFGPDSSTNTTRVSKKAPKENRRK